jgi:hypothetical protein
MKLCLKIFVVAIVAAFTYSLIGCAAPTGFSYQNVGITLTEYCTYSCSQIISDPNIPYAWEIGQIEYFFTATAQNAPPNFTWALYPTENLTEPAPYPTGSSATGVGENSLGPTDGYFDSNSKSGNTVIYWTASPPIFSGAALQQAENFQYTTAYTQQTLSVQGVPSITTVNGTATGIPQGDVLLAVSVPSSANDPTKTYTYYQLMEITGGLNVYLSPTTPTNPSGLTTSVVTVPRGTSFQFYGGAVGNSPCGTTAACALQATGYQTLNSIDNTVIWEVGASPSTAVVGGNSTYGTISTSGLYTAPATIPSGTICVVMAAHANLAKTLNAYLTVN